MYTTSKSIKFTQDAVISDSEHDFVDVTGLHAVLEHRTQASNNQCQPGNVSARRDDDDTLHSASDASHPPRHQALPAGDPHADVSNNYVINTSDRDVRRQTQILSPDPAVKQQSGRDACSKP